MEGFNVWWYLKGEGRTSFSSLFTFRPNNFTWTLFFPFISRFYLPWFWTVILCLSFFFLINYNHASWCTKSSTHSLLNWFWLIFFSFPWIHGIAHDHFLWASSCTIEWGITSIVIPRFDIDATSSWWKSRTIRNVPSSWSGLTFGNEPKTIYESC